MSVVERLLLFGPRLFLRRQLCPKFLKLKQALNLKILCVNYALTMLVGDIDIREYTLNDRLEARIFNFKNRSVFEKGKSTACFEYCLDDVDDTLDLDIFFCKVVAACRATITINNSVNNAARLHEEVDVQRRIYIPQEVLVNCYKNFHCTVVIDGIPDCTQLLIHVCQIV